MSSLASDCRGAQARNRSPTKALHSLLDLPFASAAGTGQGAGGRARAFLSIPRPHRELTNGASILRAGDSLYLGQDAFAPSGSIVGDCPFARRSGPDRVGLLLSAIAPFIQGSARPAIQGLAYARAATSHGTGLAFSPGQLSWTTKLNCGARPGGPKPTSAPANRSRLTGNSRGRRKARSRHCRQAPSSKHGERGQRRRSAPG